MSFDDRNVVPRPNRIAARSDRSHTRRRLIGIAAVAALLVSCGEPVEQYVTLTFDDSATYVTVTTQTKLNKAKPGTPDAKLIDEARSALTTGHDEWSFRFANADPRSEKTSFEKVDRELVQAEHSGTFPVENLQRFFSDTPLTVNVTRGEGWTELVIYPGESTRATRQQKREVEERLARFSEHAVRYFTALRSMYRYLDANDARAEAMFTALFEDDKDKQPPLSDDELAYVEKVRKALDNMTGDEEGASSSIDQDFDRAFNPFPAAMTVTVRGTPLLVEGFTRSADGALKIEMTGALEAVGSLEGRWVTPDPLATAANSTKEKTAVELARSMAGQQRRAVEVVRAEDVAEALMQKMRPAPKYLVRWPTKAKASS